jgi:hypothetical protein
MGTTFITAETLPLLHPGHPALAELHHAFPEVDHDRRLRVGLVQLEHRTDLAQFLTQSGIFHADLENASQVLINLGFVLEDAHRASSFTRAWESKKLSPGER